MRVKRKTMGQTPMYAEGGGFADAAKGISAGLGLVGQGIDLYSKVKDNFANGGEFPFRPPGPPTKEEAKFLRQQMAVDEGLRALMQRELRGRDKLAMRNNTPFESESAVLLEMLESGQMNREDAMRKGKRRRFAKQAAPILGEMALATALGAGTLQNQHERQTGTRPNFGQALRMIFGGQ